VIRLMITAVLMVIGDAVGLIIAAAILDDMSLDWSGFLIAVLLFTGVDFVAQPLIIKIGLQHARPLVGSSSLVATFIALVVTTIVTDGLQITGAMTWVLATVIAWAGAMVAGLVLPVLFLKGALVRRKGAPARPVTTWP
jgi:putative membrane protein